MLAHMKRQTTGDSVEILLKVPKENARQVEEAIAGIFALSGHKLRHVNCEGEELIPADEVFPDAKPGDMVKGLRVREGITQKQMAEKLGVRQRHISEMEKNVRPITLEMAKRIGETFDISYKIFL
ncbi:MAG: helix-turn-helix domain-containing protein [Candidatus Adiutrix sp.]|jgi:DNA-binding XRE family transcriptional regulator|nr:helix-turn-helix domain-containing protein [Candidatus Adiutrix sp.]